MRAAIVDLRVAAVCVLALVGNATAGAEASPPTVAETSPPVAAETSPAAAAAGAAPAGGPAPVPAGAAAAAPVANRAYPLDGFGRTGIRRLRAYEMSRRGELAGGPSLPRGALLSTSDIRLRLVETGSTYDIDARTPRDPELQRGLETIFADRDPNYSIAILDITEPAAPRYAAIDDTRTYLPGSVGKILVMTGLFGALAESWPDDEQRLRVLRETSVTADRFILTDSHTVPIVDLGAPSLAHRPIELDDTFSLFEWVDHMVSPSSNAAGATTWKQAMLMRRFGREYPPAPEAAAAFLESTPKDELRELAVATLEEPLRRAGLDTGSLRQGTMFTSGGERVVPGTRSYASPRQLLRWLLRLEQGRIVDAWSSLEMKRLLYYTRRRYRYAVSPALEPAAVYFKSGSFYQCREEAGFQCRQYRGNVTNIMNSVAIVESPARPEPGQPQRVYLVAMMSNVLRRNSAEDHRDIATAIDGLVAGLHR